MATYAAIEPWTTSYGMAGLNIAASGSTFTALPLSISNPCGWFIHPLVLITSSAESAEAMVIGMLQSQCARGERRSHP